MFAVLFNVIAPVLICIAIGYGWGKSPAAYATDFVTRLITTLGAPCLIVATINSSSMGFAEFTMLAKYTVLVLAGTLVLALALLRLLRMDPLLALPVVMPNVGNMGLSLSLFAFGEPGLALALVIFVVTSLIQFTSGDLVLSREGSIPRRLAMLTRQPLVYGTLAAVVMVATGWKLPPALASTVSLLAGITIPLMLITLGVSLARLSAGNWRAGLVIALARSGLGLVVSIGLVAALGIGGLAAKILILQSAMPSAVFNYLFALKHDRDPGAVASGVVISTFLSLLLIPVILWFLL
ncbi:MAG: AEC family transporter [Porticoccaceae bacterium]